MKHNNLMSFNQLKRMIHESFDDNPGKYGEIVAIVAGSFKPPTAGHLSMIQHYAKIADKVIVLISSPTSKKSLRLTANNKVITPQMSKDIFDILLKRYDLDDKVEVRISDKPSPIAAAFDILDSIDNCNVILGVSKKDDDIMRFSTAKKYVENRPNLNLIDPAKTAVDPAAISGKAVSASDIRKNINNSEVIRKLMPDKVTDDDFEKILNILNG